MRINVRMEFMIFIGDMMNWERDFVVGNVSDIGDMILCLNGIGLNISGNYLKKKRISHSKQMMKVQVVMRG